MAYGKIKADALTWDNAGSDVDITISTIPDAATVAAKADLASPALTGTPTAPTAAQGTNTTQLATTEYVQSEVGVSIQAYDADTAKTDVVQTFTAAQTFNAGASDGSGNFRSVPQNSQTAAYTLVAADIGKHVNITTGGVTVPSSVFSAGDAVSIYNDSASDQTITQGASVTLRLAGDGTTGNKTLAGYGLCTVLCVASDEFVIAGTGLS